ncbi:MAG: cytochrome P450 [Polyangiaceae bacterium]
MNDSAVGQQSVAPILSTSGSFGARFFGHLRDFQKSPWETLRRFNAECGGLGRVVFLGNSLLVVNTPELVGELLVANAQSCRKSPIVRAALFPLVGDGLFTSEEELWRRQRKLMAPLFHPSRVEAFADMMSRAASRAVETWRDGQEIDVMRETTRIAMAVAGKSLFDIDTFDEADELGAALTTALHWSAETATSVALGLQFEAATQVRKLSAHMPGALREQAVRAAESLTTPIRLPTRRNRVLAEAISIIDRRVERMIAERRASRSTSEDLLTRLLDARDEGGGVAMTDRQLRDEIVTLFVAGHETTANALGWALYLLGRSPAPRARLFEEIGALRGEPAALGDLARLPYTQQVFKESLRLYPPVPVYERQVLEPFEIGGYHLARGEFATVFPWALHHRPELYPDPETFDPDRFTAEAEEKRPRYTFVPFGAGPRVCIGNHFALLEGPLVLATMLGRVELEACDDKPVDMDPMAATLRPLGSIRMRVRRRDRRPS